MNQNKVTVLSACYNCTGHIHRLLDSILQQDYHDIEMILIDDGSSDNLASYLDENKYYKKFKERNFQLKYFYQKNQGQASAIKNGLKHVEGNFLIWPDSDDYLNINQISKMVNTFKLDNSIGVVRCYSNHIDEKGNLQDTFQGMYNKKEGLNNIFLDCLYFTNNMYFGAGNYMVIFERLKSSLKSFEIFEHKLTGQNWQLILPVTYHHNTFTINEKLHNIVELSNSHSRHKKSFAKSIKTQLSHRNTLIHTLNNIQDMKEDYRSELILSIKKTYFKRMITFLKSTLKKMIS